MQHHISIRNQHLMIFPLNHTDQQIAAHLFAGVDDLLSAPCGTLRNPETNQVHLSLREGVHLHGGGNLNQPRNICSGGQLRVDGHGQAKLFLDKPDFSIIAGVAHPGYCLTVSCLSRNQAAQEIHLILVGHRNQQVSLLHAGFLLHMIAGGISLNAHHIQKIPHHVDLLFIRIDDRDFMSLFIELLGKNIAHLPTACNNDSHQ